MRSFAKFLETRELTKDSATGLGVFSDKWREDNNFSSWVANVNKQLRHYVRYLQLDHTPGRNPYMSIDFGTITNGLRNNLENLAELINPATIAGLNPQEAIQRILSQDDVELLTRGNFMRFYPSKMNDLKDKSKEAFKRIIQFVQEVTTQFKHWANYYQ